MNISGIPQVSSAISAQQSIRTQESATLSKALDQMVAEGVGSLKLIQSAAVPAQPNSRTGNNINLVV
ncbi:MAG: hypothetical protein OEW63_06090 [Gammaproteobacteria bacterium]|nr:hypothetical protein [Gammaproteobacteria bacterium]